MVSLRLAAQPDRGVPQSLSDSPPRCRTQPMLPLPHAPLCVALSRRPGWPPQPHSPPPPPRPSRVGQQSVPPRGAPPLPSPPPPPPRRRRPPPALAAITVTTLLRSPRCGGRLSPRVVAPFASSPSAWFCRRRWFFARCPLAPPHPPHPPQSPLPRHPPTPLPSPPPPTPLSNHVAPTSAGLPPPPRCGQRRL